jgi:hypothetical protein
MRLKLAYIGALAALAAVLSITAATATAAPTRSLTASVTAAQSGGALDGVINFTGFTLNSAGKLVANGTFTGAFTDATGAVTQLTDAVFSSIVTPSQTGGGCQILDLTLGPLNLDVLGLVVTLNQVHLNITAQPGPGNLLGNLLCGVAHLLDNNGPLTGLQNLLNRLNALLGV